MAQGLPKSSLRMFRKTKTIALYFHNQIKLLNQTEQSAAEKLSQSKVHDLRVTTRRVRAVLWLLKHSSTELHFKSLEHALRKLGKSLGNFREISIAINDAKIFSLNSDPLTLLRKNSKKRIRPLLKQKKRKKMFDRLKKIERKLATFKSLNMKRAWEDLQAEILACKKLQMRSKQYQRYQSQLHFLRITTKKTRYALEATGQAVKELERLQDLLGKAHDLYVLQKYLGRHTAITQRQKHLTAEALSHTKPALSKALRLISGEIQRCD